MRQVWTAKETLKDLLQNNKGKGESMISFIGTLNHCATLRIASGILVLGICVVPSQAVAQDLPNVPGYTELQQNSANYIQSTCARFGPAGYTANINGTPQEKLFFSCRAMVQSANQVVPGGGAAVAFSLGLTEEQLRTGVQALAPVQMNAQKQMGTEASKINGVATRLFDLRAGAAGFAVSLNGLNVSPTRVASSSRNGTRAATGGAASADADLGGGRWGGFANISYNWGNVDQTAAQDAYKFGGTSIVGGVDYRVNESVVLGGVIQYNYTDAEYDQSLGSVKSSTVGVGGYGTYYSGNWYLDGVLSYGHASYDTTRNMLIAGTAGQINAVATASPKGEQVSASVGTGYNMHTEMLDVTPFVRFNYITVRNKAFQEDEPAFGLGLAVNERTVQSAQSALGLRLSKSVNTSSGVLVPYITIQWLHEFKNGSPSITAKYVNDPFSGSFFIPTEQPDRNYAVFTFGTSATFANNLTAFVQFGTAAFLDNIRNYSIVAGLRKQF